MKQLMKKRKILQKMCIRDSVDIHKVANHVKPFPLEWIDEKNKKIKKEYIDYVVPLIYKSGQIELPQYLQLNER